MEGLEGNGRKRKPFSDLTNARSLSSSSAPSPRKRKAKLDRKYSERKFSPSSNIDLVSVRSKSSIGSSTAENPVVREIPKPNPRRDEKSVDCVGNDDLLVITNMSILQFVRDGIYKEGEEKGCCSPRGI